MSTIHTDSNDHTKENKGHLWDGNCDEECLIRLDCYDKHHKLGDLINPHLFSHGARGSRSGCQQGWVLDENILPDLQTATFPLCPHRACFSLEQREKASSLGSLWEGH